MYMYIYIYIYIYIYVNPIYICIYVCVCVNPHTHTAGYQPRGAAPIAAYSSKPTALGLDKILFYVKACVHESILIFAYSP